LGRHEYDVIESRDIIDDVKNWLAIGDSPAVYL